MKAPLRRGDPAVLLVRPPDPLQDSPLLSHTRPMNLAYLAAALRRQGFRPVVADYEVTPWDEGQFQELVRRVRPVVVGLSCTTPTVVGGARIAAAAKAVGDGALIVVGGPHATALPERTLVEFPSFDCVVVGEGEATFGELCGRAAGGGPIDGVSGIAFRQGGRVARTPPRPLLADLDRLPLPARDLLPPAPRAGHSTRGFSNRLPAHEVYTSRGCPVACSFCAIQATFGRTVRYRSPEAVAEELDALTRTYGPCHLIVADDTFTLDPERAAALCGLFRRAGVPSWSCDTRANAVSPALLREMRASGCRKVAFGVESGSPRVLRSVGKGITPDQVRSAVGWARDAGIEHIEGNFIVGADPDEAPEDLALTRTLLRSLPWTFVSVSVVVPYPGTPLHARMEEAGLIEPSASWEDFVLFGRTPRWRTRHCSAEGLVAAQRRLTREFYLRPSYIGRQLLKMRSWDDVRYWASLGSGYLTWLARGRV